VSARKITVVGAGVIGLSTAIRLCEAGFDVRVISKDNPQDTTSSVAAAIWYPYHVGDYDRRWATRTLEVFQQLLPDPAAGITQIVGHEYSGDPWPADYLEQAFWWRDQPGVNFRHLTPPELPGEFVAGVEFHVPVIHMPTYLDFLQVRYCDRSGQRVEAATLLPQDLPAILKSCDLLVNCTGLGAGRLFGDTTLIPFRGQVVLIPATGFDKMILLATGQYAGEWPLYIVPRGNHDVVLGGTCTRGDRNLSADAAITERIRQMCARVYPQVMQAPITEVKVGLRPCRYAADGKEIGPRMEVETVQGRPVIHNYGHGGGGVSLSWGCAEGAVQLCTSCW
jgi:D-amino-acid oxidase